MHIELTFRRMSLVAGLVLVLFLPIASFGQIPGTPVSQDRDDVAPLGRPAAPKQKVQLSIRSAVLDGQLLTIRGESFGAAAGTVEFGASDGTLVALTPDSWSDTEVTATLTEFPLEGASSTYRVIVTNTLVSPPASDQMDVTGIGQVTSAGILDGTIGAAEVDSSQVQLRVTGSCVSGNFVRSINDNGTVTCGFDDKGVTEVTATSPLISTGGTTPNISISPRYLKFDFNSAGRADVTALGDAALWNNTRSSDPGPPSYYTGGFANTAVGGDALYENTTGANNTAHGYLALRNNTTGWDNTATGRDSMLSNSSGKENTATGFQALWKNSDGHYNTALGYRALQSNTNGAQNTAVGYQADVSAGGLNNATAVGATAIADASNMIQLGNGLVTLVRTSGDMQVGACVKDKGGAHIAGTCSSDAQLKTDVRPFEALLDRLVQLEPVHFRWSATAEPVRRYEATPSFGLLAQQTEAVLPDLVVEGENGYKAVRYHMLPLLLLKGLKEQQQIIERQEAENAGLRARVERLERFVHSLAAVDEP